MSDYRLATDYLLDGICLYQGPSNIEHGNLYQPTYLVGNE